MEYIWIYWLLFGIIPLLFNQALSQVCNPPCQNGGMCKDTECGMRSSPCCECMDTGYGGGFCELPKVMNCNPNPCQFGGMCTVDDSSNLGYRCQCADGRSGQICEKPLTNAACVNSNDCNGATCANGECDCTSIGDYYGTNCENKKSIVGFEDLEYSFRENEGTVDVYLTREFNIDIQIDAWVHANQIPASTTTAIENVDYIFSPNPMTENFSNGANRRRIQFTLIDDPDTEGDEYFELTLEIHPNFVEMARVDESRKLARVKIEGGDGTDGCNAPSDQRTLCANGGTCRSDGSCTCTTEWTGATCTRVHACFNDQNLPCLNGASCAKVAGDPDFECTCADGYEGTRCDQIVSDACNPDPCKNSGICSITSGGYECNCDGTEFVGSTCSVVPDACNPDPCENGGICSITSGGYECNCDNTGFEGATCSVDAGGGSGGDPNDPGNNDPQGGSVSTTTIIIIVVIAVIILLIIAISVTVYAVRRKRRQRSKSNSRDPPASRGVIKDNTYADRMRLENRKPEPSQRPHGKNTKGHHKRTATVYDKSERKIGAEFARKSLILHEHLGSGAFANVVRGDAMGIVRKRVNTIVAVKMLKEMATDSDKSDFMKELQVYRMLDTHPNIIVMLGCCTDREPYYLIMEYAPHGNLQSHIRGIRNAPESPYNNIESGAKNFLTPTEILQFGSQIANGMKYLAEKQCIHRDLATRNVLLGDGLVCKLSDFGLARDVSDDNAYEMRSKGRVPVRWMALESLLENTYTTKSDVWSFGVLMWELVTVGSHPYPGMSSKKVIQELQNGFRLPRPEHCSTDIYSIMQDCWQERPEKRPTFEQIHQQLEQMLEDANGYLTMTEFNVSSYVYLDPGKADLESDAENDEHEEPKGLYDV